VHISPTTDGEKVIFLSARAERVASFHPIHPSAVCDCCRGDKGAGECERVYVCESERANNASERERPNWRACSELHHLDGTPSFDIVLDARSAQHTHYRLGTTGRVCVREKERERERGPAGLALIRSSDSL
jgi:hypothetical protein